MFSEALCEAECPNYIKSGLGLYVRAGEFIPSGSVLGPYTGEILSTLEALNQRSKKTDECEFGRQQLSQPEKPTYLFR